MVPTLLPSAPSLTRRSDFHYSSRVATVLRPCESRASQSNEGSTSLRFVADSPGALITEMPCKFKHRVLGAGYIVDGRMNIR
jgi:hypothetical protein